MLLIAGMGNYKTFGGVPIGSAGPSQPSLAARINRELAAVLNTLVHLSRDLVVAYSAAVDRLDDTDLRDQLRQLGQTHERNIDMLCDAIKELGHSPARRGDFRAMLERGRVVLGERKGDAGIVRAMAANEELLRSAIQQALARPHLAAAVAEMLDVMLATEQRHHRFYNEALGRFLG